MKLQRRTLLSGLAAAAVCPICSNNAASAAESNGHVKHWTYDGDEGPNHWGKLTPDHKACDIGAQQSPINLAQPIPSKLKKLDIKWKEFPLSIINNGHTIQVNVPPGCTIAEDGITYKLVQFHFHHPSEHLIDGAALPMEIHFVHFNERMDLALVLGVFIAEGSPNDLLGKIFSDMPKEKGESKTVLAINPNNLLPESFDRFHYQGSLTTPPCSEIINWNVLRSSITASSDQIRAFAALFINNARPVMPLNRRFLLQG